LEEDRVWRESFSPTLSLLRTNVLRLCHYGFTEIFNNVLDHSGATRAMIGFTLTPAHVEMVVFDNGVGIFCKIKNELGLEDERHAILELTKGKLTTDPKGHTGEGIFFASRMFDDFSIMSGHLFFNHQEPDDDWLIEHKAKARKGTVVTMMVSTAVSRTTREVFDRYASADGGFAFTKTHVPVRLLRYGEENLVSRSQAKRLLARFDKFEEVLLDFDGVKLIGHAFADEIFRVFRQQNPAVKLLWARATEDVERMIRRALGGSYEGPDRRGG
ncbi:MAG: DUF4325 domain-containing protein, partial [Planctomycetes bacterium]|nr:DUF4325 domain-containing protein [Planctomycetota bacterium]